MPSTSKKQADFMRAVAHSPEFAKKAGVPQSVGKEFSNADKNRKFKEGGDTMASKMNAGFTAMMAKKKGAPAKKMASGGMAKMGSVKTAAPSKDGLSTVKTKGKIVTMKSGGRTC
jgi:hypothetical protein